MSCGATDAKPFKGNYNIFLIVKTKVNLFLFKWAVTEAISSPQTKLA